jgi:hypothetical protein
VSQALNEFLEKMPPDERLKGMPPDDRMKGLSVEEFVKGLSPEVREALARQLKANGS